MKVVYPFHSLIRRNLTIVERLIAAAGLGALLYALMHTLPVYPQYWDVVIVAVVAMLTLWSPVAGYFVAVLAAVYPLFTVSIYLAVLFLAIAVIGQHLFIQNLGGTLLTLASPVLGSVYLAWTVPLLGGLWWGPAGGALMGALGAFWGMLVGALIGMQPDWLQLFGVLPVVDRLPEQFASANSLETLGLLFRPFAPDSTSLLYHLLQIASWAAVGWAVGMFSEKDWVQFRRPRAGMAVAAVGALVLALLHIVFNLWLAVPVLPTAWTALGLTMVCSALAVVLLEFIQNFFEYPLPAPGRAPARRARVSPPSAPTSASADGNLSTSTLQNSVETPPETEDDDLIMLELD